MITKWHDKEALRIWNMKYSKNIPNDLQSIARRKLVMIDAAANINDLRIPPSNHLEKLSGNRNGQYSIRVNNSWRICFIWNNGNAEIIDIVNYH